MRPAHPRAGEENREGNTRSQFVFGSSPRGRGKPQVNAHPPIRGGLIPARAGKTRSPGGPEWRRPAHPRAGGENSLAAGARGRVRGSSPRGRGKQIREGDAEAGRGLIPA